MKKNYIAYIWKFFLIKIFFIYFKILYECLLYIELQVLVILYFIRNKYCNRASLLLLNIERNLYLLVVNLFLF